MPPESNTRDSAILVILDLYGAFTGRQGHIDINCTDAAILPIVDEDALVEALQSGQIWAAGMDAFATEPLPSSHPLLQMDNMFCTPHIAGVTKETTQRRGQAAATNVERVSQGLEPLHLVTPDS